MWREITAWIFSIRINQLSGHYIRNHQDARWPTRSEFMPCCLESPTSDLHTHTPEAYPEHPALKRGMRKHRHWAGRGSGRPQVLRDAGQTQVTAAAVTKGWGCPELCATAGSRVPPAPGTAWVPPQWLPRQRRDVRQDSFLITAMAQVSITFRRRLE